jgi:hypothetical protein
METPNSLVGGQLDEDILPPPSVEDPRTADRLTHLEPLRARLLDSEAYFTSLSELEQNIWLNSSLCAANSWIRSDLEKEIQSESPMQVVEVAEFGFD